MIKQIIIYILLVSYFSVNVCYSYTEIFKSEKLAISSEIGKQKNVFNLKINKPQKENITILLIS